jgi:hypothetical protein
MKLNVLTLALAATAFGALAANAQTTVIEERRDPAIVIERERPDTSVTIEKSGPLGIQKKSTTVETTGSGECSSKTVHREGLVGSSTTKKTTCD